MQALGLKVALWTTQENLNDVVKVVKLSILEQFHNFVFLQSKMPNYDSDKVDLHASPAAVITLNQSKAKTSILDKSLSKAKQEIHLSCFALLFSEMVQYCQNRSTNVVDLQNK